MAIPANPTGLKAVYNPDAQAVTLNWNIATGAVTYRIQRWVNTLQLYSELTTVPGNTSYYIDASVTGGLQYAYRMLSQNADGNPTYFSAPSNKVWVIDPPAPVADVVTTKNGDGSTTTTWTNMPTVAAPYDYHYIKRWDNVTRVFTQINRIAGNLSSYLDSTAPVDRELKYRIFTSNLIAGGAVEESEPSASIFTDPLEPTNIVLRWVDDDVVVTWSNPSTIAAGFAIEHTVDGIEWDPVAEVGRTNSWRHVGAERGSPHRYQIKAFSPTPTVGTRSESDWSTSTWLAAQTTPNPPTLLGPAFAPTGEAFPMQYRHNPTSPDSPEGGVQLRYRNAGSSTWSTTVAGSTVPSQAGTGVVEVSMATRTVDSGWSNWSDPLPIQLRARPAPSVGSPTAGAVIVGPVLPLAWTFSGQVAWEAELQKGGVVIETRSGTSEKSTTFSVEGESGYAVRLRVFDGYLWSNWASRSVTTDFAVIAQAQLSHVIDLERGSVEVSFDPNPTFVRAELLRRRAGTTVWETVGDAEGTIAYDPLPPLRTDLEYVIVGWSSAGASSISEVEQVRVEKQSVMINYGPGYGSVVEVECDVSPANEDIEVDVTLHEFAGRSLPVEVYGTITRHRVSVSGAIYSIDGELTDTNAAWTAVMKAQEHWFRDYTGLSFKASLARISNQRSFYNSELSFVVTEVGS